MHRKILDELEQWPSHPNIYIYNMCNTLHHSTNFPLISLFHFVCKKKKSKKRRENVSKR